MIHDDEMQCQSWQATPFPPGPKNTTSEKKILCFGRKYSLGQNLYDVAYKKIGY